MENGKDFNVIQKNILEYALITRAHVCGVKGNKIYEVIADTTTLSKENFESKASKIRSMNLKYRDEEGRQKGFKTSASYPRGYRNDYIPNEHGGRNIPEHEFYQNFQFSSNIYGAHDSGGFDDGGC